MRIRVFASADELARATATLMAVRAARAIVERGQANLALAGGAAPLAVYRALTQEPLLEVMPWRACHFFWGEELAVPFGDPRSHHGQAGSLLRERAGLKPGQLHPVPVDIYDPQEAAARYQAELRTHFGGLLPAFDFILLGLGPEGQMGPLHPGLHALEGGGWVEAVSPPPGDQPLAARVCLTWPVLNAGRTVVVAASGAGQRRAVALALAQAENGAKDSPARRLMPHGELFWFLDREAAQDLRP